MPRSAGEGKGLHGRRSQKFDRQTFKKRRAGAMPRVNKDPKRAVAGNDYTENGPVGGTNGHPKGSGTASLAERDEPPVSPELPGKITIEITTREHEVNDDAVAALARDPRVYQRGGLLVHVIRTDREEQSGGIRRLAGSSLIVPMPLALLRERLAANAEFVKYDGRSKTYVPAHPPDWCVKAVHARGQWPSIRHLVGVTDVPVLRPDGTTLNTQGYDKATGLLFLPGGPVPKISAQPGILEVFCARRRLLDLVSDFPFASEEHRAAWVAFLLTPLARHAFDGPAPLTLIDGNVRGVGKGKLCSLGSITATGLDMPTSAAHSDDAEMRKSITAAAIAGDNLIVLDNVTGVLGGPALNAALTSTRWKERILGTNTKVDLPMLATWAATGNNVMLQADTARRVLHVRLNSQEEYPEDRSDFKHPDLLAYTREHRTELLAAALTILRGYCAAGRPDMRLKPWGSFEAWSDLVRSAVVWAGLPDPGATREEVRRNSDPEAAALPALLAGIEYLDPANRGVSVATLLEKSKGEDPTMRALRDALITLCPGKGEGDVGSPGSVGMKLHHLQGRVVNGKYLQRGQGTPTLWKVVKASEGD
jgi:hypothetical protein